MTALYSTTGKLTILHGGRALASIPIPTENPRGLVDAANAVLRHMRVDGNSPAARRARTLLAEGVCTGMWKSEREVAA